MQLVLPFFGSRTDSGGLGHSTAVAVFILVVAVVEGGELACYVMGR